MAEPGEPGGPRGRGSRLRGESGDSGLSFEIGADRAARAPGITAATICFAAGIAIGGMQPAPIVWPWIVAAGAGSAFALCGRRDALRRHAGMAATLVALGAGWLVVRRDWDAPSRLLAWVGAERSGEVGAPIPARLTGRAITGPEVHGARDGPLGGSAHHGPRSSFTLRVDGLVGRESAILPMGGTVLVRVDGPPPRFEAGARIAARGMLRPPSAPRNPGEFDRRPLLRSRGIAGVLLVPSAALLEVTAPAHETPMDAVLRWRGDLRHRAAAALSSGVGAARNPERDALLAALLLGRRDEGLDGIGDAFRRVGLAHLLAISGLHVGILAGVLLAVARGGGHARRWHGFLIVITALVYLLIVETRMPVLRAGVMTIVAGLGMGTGRRWRLGGLVAVSAFGLLAWRPEELFRPGFQLSFGVVLGLVHLVPALLRSGATSDGLADRARDTPGLARTIGARLKDAAIVAVVAWAIATPIAMHHFGMFSPWGAPLSVAAVPIVAVLLTVGFVKTLLTMIAPAAAPLLGAPLAIAAEALLGLVRFADAMPGAVVYLAPPPAAWAAVTVAWVGAARWVLTRRQSVARRLWLGAGAILIAWPAVPRSSGDVRPRLRIDMLAVGDGSCYVVRAGGPGGATLVFDAGSSGDPETGRRVIVPALRRIGVRAVDILVISHPNLDHFSAVPPLVDAFAPRRVLVPPSFVAAADREPRAPPAALRAALAQRGLTMAVINAGARLPLGPARVRCLHPGRGDVYADANDSSIVLAVEMGSTRVLLTGDIEEAAIADLLARDLSPGWADVVELPHHGSFNEAAAALVRRLRPKVLLQSTGSARWRRDEWADVVPGRGGSSPHGTGRPGSS